MMTRRVAFAGVIAIGALLYFQLMPPKSTITVSEASAAPMGGDGTTFMVSLNMQNEGEAVTLIGVRSPSGADVSLMIPQPGPLVIPGGGQGLLAMDGAHVMLSVAKGDFEVGAFQSIALAFDDGSEVVARVLRPEPTEGMGMMHHDMSQGVEEVLSPTISFASSPTVNTAGFDINLALNNFTFVRAADDATHVPNEGHAHVYLNGLKLGRLYETQYKLGALLPGDYVLRVALNTHDHRPYVANASPVEVVLEFQIQ